MAERTPKQNTIHKADVKVGSTYAVKVSGRIVPVTIDSIGKATLHHGREVTQWSGLNRQTGNRVTIRSAAKLRYELVRQTVWQMIDCDDCGQQIGSDSSPICVAEDSTVCRNCYKQRTGHPVNSDDEQISPSKTRWVRKDSPVVFERVDPPADVLAAVAFMTVGWNPRAADFQMAEFLHVADDPLETRIATIADYCWDHLMGEPTKPTLAQVEKAIRANLRRDVTRDELQVLCGEDAPEQCQEFEDESGRWARVSPGVASGGGRRV